MCAIDDTVRDWLQLIRSEYLEMPGMALTKPQAQRLWGLDPLKCDTVLDALVDVRFLERTASAQYVKAEVRR